MQYSSISADEKTKIREGLLRYCELDTMATVFIFEGWIDMLPIDTAAAIGILRDHY
jgi:hypothetical protein